MNNVILRTSRTGLLSAASVEWATVEGVKRLELRVRRNPVTAPVVFYAWQNDRPKDSTRAFIREAAFNAVCRVGSTMRIEDSPRLDHDTENEPGTPAISETILHKIKHSAMLIADMTFCSEIRDGDKVKKKNPNPNVMMELGYGAAIIGWERVILVMNKHYGSPEWLPFDLTWAAPTAP